MCTSREAPWEMEVNTAHSYPPHPRTYTGAEGLREEHASFHRDFDCHGVHSCIQYVQYIQDVQGGVILKQIYTNSELLIR